MAGWLDEVVKAAQSDEPVLILCRTAATVRAVYRRFAEEASAGGRSGWAGVEVATLAGLMSAAAPGVLRPEPAAAIAELPEGHPWKRSLDPRPGLRRILRGHVEWLHGAKLAGHKLRGLRRELRELVDSGWGTPDYLAGAKALIDGAAARPRAKVLALGFAPEPFSFLGMVSPLDRALLEALGATLVASADPSRAAPGPLPALRLADTVAEARAVAREAAAGGRVLVLVPDTPTEERVHAALRRNGIPVADDAASPLTRHALDSIVEPLLPLFASHGAEPVEARALLRLFTDPVLSRRPPKGAAVEVEGEDAPRAGVRQVREMIVGCRRARATLDEWQLAFAAMEGDAEQALAGVDEERRPAAVRRLCTARVLAAQLDALIRRARGEGRLADLAGLLGDLGLSSPAEDRLGRAVLAALRESGHRPADPDVWREVLEATLGSGRADRGVEVLSYLAYDGRDCDLLLLTGVNDKGLAKAPSPDPILAADELEALGLPAPRRAIDERLALARWAATRARRTLALVTETDASGRRVTPPIDLELAFDDRDQAASYGLSFTLPENRDAGALAAGAGEPDPLGREADAEWARAGASFEGQPPPLEPLAEGATLADQLRRDLPRFPPDLLPMLGSAGAVPGGSSGLPDGFSLSASRLQAFTQCLYRAFCQSVLHLKPVQEIEEDLDAREVGTAVHAALEEALHGLELLVPESRLEQAREQAWRRLCAATSKQIEEAVKQRPAGTDTPSLAFARQGLAERWANHWKAYVRERIRSLEEASLETTGDALAELKDSPLMEELLDAAGGPGLAMSPRKTLRSKLFEAVSGAGGDLSQVLSRVDEIAGALAAKHQGRVAGALRGEARPVLEQMCREARTRLAGVGYHPAGDLKIAKSELLFGEFPEEKLGTPLRLTLGRAPVLVRGSIDAVLVRRGPPGARLGPTYRVVDFKTGSAGGDAGELLDTLLRPQLVLYALALEALGPLDGAKGPAQVEEVELDYVRQLDKVGAALSASRLERARAVLGELLDRARDGLYAAAPHPDGCPLLKPRKAYCDFAELCRLRAHYAPEPGEGAE